MNNRELVSAVKVALVEIHENESNALKMRNQDLAKGFHRARRIMEAKLKELGIDAPVRLIGEVCSA